MKNKSLQNLILSAMFLGLGLVLPFLTGQIQQIGSMLLPMHIPVLLCGLICGWKYGLIVGLITPVLRSFLFSMPPMYPKAISMAFELGTYGLVAGFTYFTAKWQCVKTLYRSLVYAMISGRIVWGIAMLLMTGVTTGKFTLGVFITEALLSGIPGIIVQLVLIPVIMVALNKAKLVPFMKTNSEGKKVYANK